MSDILTYTPPPQKKTLPFINFVLIFGLFSNLQATTLEGGRGSGWNYLFIVTLMACVFLEEHNFGGSVSTILQTSVGVQSDRNDE